MIDKTNYLQYYKQQQQRGSQSTHDCLEHPVVIISEYYNIQIFSWLNVLYIYNIDGKISALLKMLSVRYA